MKIVLLITVIESFVVALLLILWRFRSMYSMMPARTTLSDPVNLPSELRRRSVLDESRWTFINRWKVEPQSDDRMPVSGDVAQSAASPSARRSTARRTHQAMYKEWSKQRHD